MDLSKLYNGSAKLLNLLDDIWFNYENKFIRCFLVKANHFKRSLHLMETFFINDNLQNDFQWCLDGYLSGLFKKSFILLFNVNLFGNYFIFFFLILTIFISILNFRCKMDYV